MNWVAIVVAAIAQFIIGWIWYGPLFGKTWMSMMGMSQQSMSREGMGKTMVLTFIGSLVTAAVLSMLVGWMGAKTLSTGIAAGFWAWLGFVATVTLGGVLFAKMSWNLYILNNAYQLISLAVMGAILAKWG
ncbi:MAG: DUF1761 domain-containing protein [Bacillati bacterium ANGP1]|uniref:DUF1761 domain-containing protein n=1 Tax=Candidatus Segetimicrobium genomatis TaxID=2569760 RepID=A0A537IZ06_9BACT|nr:MAG: DUF1761 domain-containing protein [Terrabacteria group bacterium ANGP1]